MQYLYLTKLEVCVENISRLRAQHSAERVLKIVYIYIYVFLQEHCKFNTIHHASPDTEFAFSELFLIGILSEKNVFFLQKHRLFESQRDYLSRSARRGTSNSLYATARDSFVIE